MENEGKTFRNKIQANSESEPSVGPFSCGLPDPYYPALGPPWEERGARLGLGRCFAESQEGLVVKSPNKGLVGRMGDVQFMSSAG